MPVGDIRSGDPGTRRVGGRLPVRSRRHRHSRRRRPEAGIGVSTFVSLGDDADVSTNDLLAYWYDDPATEIVALYVESFGNPRRFAVLARALARRKPVLAVKSGRSSRVIVPAPRTLPRGHSRRLAVDASVPAGRRHPDRHPGRAPGR